jgi:hypothetical protein
MSVKFYRQIDRMTSPGSAAATSLLICSTAFEVLSAILGLPGVWCPGKPGLSGGLGVREERFNTFHKLLSRNTFSLT